MGLHSVAQEQDTIATLDLKRKRAQSADLHKRNQSYALNRTGECMKRNKRKYLKAMDVLTIRAEYDATPATIIGLANRYNLSQGTIRRIAKGQRYDWVGK